MTFPDRILGRRYWFASARKRPYASARERQRWLVPVCLVAVRSVAGESWAAYIAGVSEAEAEDDEMAEHVAIHGAKLDQVTAHAMFPDVVLPYRE